MAIAEEGLLSPRPLRWTTVEYHRLGETGWLQNRRVELIDGEIIEMSPIGIEHIKGVTLASDAVRAAFGHGYFVSVQNPLDVGDASEPQPDVAVLHGDVRGLDALPSNPVLVIEVADSSLTYDRTHKGALYARAGVPDYWIVNLVDRVLEAYRDPADGGYAAVTTLRAGESIAPLAAPHVPITVDDVMP
jgi:Uma2 family endonuclease